MVRIRVPSSGESRANLSFGRRVVLKHRLHIKPRGVSAPPPVIDLLAALKRSLANEAPMSKPRTMREAKPPERSADRRQAALLLPLSSGRNGKQEVPANPIARSFARW